MSVFNGLTEKKVTIRIGNTAHENCHFKFFLHGGKTMVFYSTTTKAQVALPTHHFIEQMENPEPEETK